MAVFGLVPSNESPAAMRSLLLLPVFESSYSCS